MLVWSKGFTPQTWRLNRNAWLELENQDTLWNSSSQAFWRPRSYLAQSPFYSFLFATASHSLVQTQLPFVGWKCNIYGKVDIVLKVILIVNSVVQIYWFHISFHPSMLPLLSSPKHSIRNSMILLEIRWKCKWDNYIITHEQFMGVTTHRFKNKFQSCFIKIFYQWL